MRYCAEMKFVAIVIAIASSALAQEPFHTPTAECVDTPPGTTRQQQTGTRSTANTRAYATITVSRPTNDKEASHCHVAYALMVSEAGQPYQSVAAFEEDGRDAIGVEITGFSPDGSKVAANFWWAAGDFTAVRPAIYDRMTRKSVVEELGEQITGQLPSCDYNETLAGVTNSGEAVVHVPKSIYVEEGCPDQGDWLFNLRTGAVRRVSQAKSTRGASSHK